MGIKEKEKEKAEEEDVIDRDLERLIIPADHIPPPTTTNINGGSELSSASSQQEAFIKLIRSWATKKFITGCVILFPIAITFYATWCFVHFVDGFFSPVYSHLGINTIGLGFVTSIAFIFLVGVFMSSWLGTSLLALGEWFIKKLPLMSYIYAASKQISSAISPDQNSRVFKEVAIIRHPRMGEYAFGFITATVVLQQISGVEELCCVYVPTNHLYLGDIFLVNSKEIIRPDISVREGIEIVISGGMSIPHMMSITDTLMIHRPRIRKYEIPQV
ncbi:protein LIKE COV 3 isoform X2 [Daucus carota subsp. sativus]|uniref:protein LIKE COV 3 isoform X2 n=1 Tax=Daucus carota subsp. sativus TaxID=79200 RepID=UPI0007EF9BA1|nr:PREDICTED: protein LIKE COV 3-like isoform X2 [Daucus carota subsp. sativus]